MAIVVDVDDTSPTIFYSPFRDTYSTPNLTAGWNPYFTTSGFATSQGEEGDGTSEHITALDGSSLTIQWQGTGIQLLGNTTDSTFSLLLDGESISTENGPLEDTLVSISNLQNTNHTLTLIAHIPTPTSLMVFESAVLLSLPPDGSTNDSFTLQSIDDNTISFHGQWTFVNSDSGSFHQSNTVGDSANSYFLGTSFLVYGTSSPNAGNYSIVLDGTTNYFSARSSFMQNDTLLFYATDLDPSVVHSFTIGNEDGSTLIVPVSGLFANATGSPNPSPFPTSSTSPTVSAVSGASSTSYPTGTIAALALAGILAFLIITGTLFYLLIYRPRRRRLRQERVARGRENFKGRETGAALDIRPHEADLTGDIHNHRARRFSGRSGFVRWKRDIESGLNGLGLRDIGLTFRHSDSIKRGETAEEIPEKGSNAAPSLKSIQSSRLKGRSRWMKQTRRDASSSPSFTIDLPGIQHVDQPYEASDAAASEHTLEYLSTPSFPSSNLPPARSTPPPNDPDSGVGHNPVQPYPNRREHVNTPLLIFPPAVNPDDRGSVRDVEDDTTSYMGLATDLTAIRSLSPRTSESRSNNGDNSQLEYAFPGMRSSRTSGPTGTQSPERQAHPPHLVVRDSSPFQVDFQYGSPTSSQKMDTNDGTVVPSRRAARISAGGLSVRFEDKPDQDTTSASASQPQFSPTRPLPQLPTAVFRLTPLAPFSARVTSFLDFSGSSDASVGSSSREISETSSHIVDTSHLKPHDLRSRWSSTTAPSSMKHEREAASSSSDSNSPTAPTAGSTPSFPFPISLPASPYHPEGHKPSPPRPLPLDVNPAVPTSSVASPVERVPTSIHYRQHSGSDSETEVTNLTARNDDRSLPPHPPLPSATSSSYENSSNHDTPVGWT